MKKFLLIYIFTTTVISIYAMECFIDAGIQLNFPGTIDTLGNENANLTRFSINTEIKDKLFVYSYFASDVLLRTMNYGNFQVFSGVKYFFKEPNTWMIGSECLMATLAPQASIVINELKKQSPKNLHTEKEYISPAAPYVWGGIGLSQLGKYSSESFHTGAGVLLNRIGIYLEISYTYIAFLDHYQYISVGTGFVFSIY